MAQHLTGVPPNGPDVLPPGPQTLLSSLLGACLSTGETGRGFPGPAPWGPVSALAPGIGSLLSDHSDP